MKSDPTVAIIIVVWNNLLDTQECLLSIEKLKYSKYHIIVVDNGSTDQSCEKIKAIFRDVIVLRNNENLGYTGGCNTGINYSCDVLDADYCFILNNDTVIDDENLLSKLVNSAAGNNDIGIVAPLIYNFNSPETIQCAGVRVDLLTGRARFLRNIAKSPIWTDAVHGCAFLIKRQTIKDVGLLDDQFFLYWEETDYCLRVRKVGYRILIDPLARIMHKSGKSIGGRGSLYTYYFFRNRLLIIKKHAPKIAWFVLAPILPIYAIIHILKSSREGNKFREAAISIIDAWYDFTRGNLGKRESGM